mmetsp:Transcript_23648/g.67313  ORF Transcript_23648/g.67313 Transcript_23648/m.67313 type:complete len:335 (-) Transcript_23648:8-1012(-)
MGSDLFGASEHEGLERVEAILDHLMVLLVVPVHFDIVLRGLVHYLQEERGDVPQVLPDPEADVPADGTDALDVLLLLGLGGGLAHVGQQRAHERVQLAVREHGGERPDAGDHLLPKRGLVLLGLQQVQQRIRHGFLVGPLHDPVVAEPLEEIVEHVGALLLHLDRGVRGDAVKHLRQHVLARLLAARSGQLGQEALQARGVDVADLRLPLEHELAELGEHLPDLLLLELAHNLGKALDGVPLHVNALILELLQEGRADPLLQVYVKHLTGEGDLVHEVGRRHEALVLVPVLHLLQQVGDIRRIHRHPSNLPGRAARRAALPAVGRSVPHPSLLP